MAYNFGVYGSNSGSPSPIAPTSLFGNPATFTAAANTQASDYDTIMAQYKNLVQSYNNNPVSAAPVSFTPVTPQTTPYTQSSDVTAGIAGLGSLAATGGYSDANIADIRARDISPIRSIYANAQQNLERQKALAGGYSPNYAATTAQTARDEANQIASTTTAANAGIAQNVAANKLAAAPAYASAAASANAAQLAANQANAATINQANQFNTAGATGAAEFNTNAALSAAQANRAGIAGAIGGQASLYGTTPALTSTFGNQVVQANQLGQNQQNINTQRLNTLGNLSKVA